MNQQTRDMMKKLSKTMRGITIITAAQLKNDRMPNYNGTLYKGPIVVDYLNLLAK